MSDTPEILDTATEREIIDQELVAQVYRTLRQVVRQDLTVADALNTIAAMAVPAVTERLKTLSARQLAVLLGEEANRHEGWVIHEPPRYTAEQTGDVR